MSEARRGIGALIIGDEIILGRREDKHLPQLIGILARRGLRLDWALMLGDDRERLTQTLQGTLAGNDIVFSFGGIGNTPDDHTRQAAAAAVAQPLQLHAEAEHEIRARYAEIGREISDYALDMGRFPRGARLIPNPFNRIPGFRIADHHFVPGFPQMAWPMVEWTLDTHYADLFHRHVTGDAALLVWEGIESVLTPLMLQIEVEFPGLKMFSLPFLGSAEQRRHIEFGVRGDPAQIAPAMRTIKAEVSRLGYAFDEKPG